MTAFSHLSMFAFGAAIGALLMGMVTFDSINGKLTGLSNSIRDSMVCFPVDKPKAKQ